jgi:hypothetical protein
MYTASADRNDKQTFSEKQHKEILELSPALYAAIPSIQTNLNHIFPY